MTNLTQKSSKQFLGAAMRVVTLALFLAVFGASAALAQTGVYVTNRNDNTVSVIDPATNTAVKTIPVGGGPSGIAVTPNGAFAYVVNEFDNTVSVIDAAAEAVVATVPVGNGPRGIAITPNGAFAYVTNASDNTVSVINTANDTVVGLPISVGGFPNGIAITPDGAFAYVVNTAGSSVSVIDTTLNLEVATVGIVDIGDGPDQIAITPNGAFAYVTGGGLSFHVFVISTATNAVVNTITLAHSSYFGIDITPNGAFAYVGSRVGFVSKIDTSTNLATDVQSGPRAQGVGIDPTGAFVYVANSQAGTVSKISTATNTLVATITVGSSPQFIAFPVRTHGPTNKDQCKNNGWQTFTNPTFKNQGQCIKFVNHMDEPEH